ncbi:Ig-like domain-containing protein [Pontibacter sp. CAU 1760]
MSRYIKTLRISVLVMVALFSIPACEFFEEIDKNPPPKPVKYKGAIFTNANDPRFAEVVTDDGQKTTFFGTRNPDGSPKSLIGYRIQALNEPDPEKADVVTFDSEGRYSNIILKTGEALHLDYLPNDSIALTLSGPEGLSDIIMVKGAKINDKQEPSLGDGGRLAGVTGADGYINIKVMSRNKFTQSEKNVKDGETTVMVRIFANSQDYMVPAHYDKEKQLYSVNYRWLGIVGEPEVPNQTFEDANAIRKIIMEAIAKACSYTETPGKEISIPQLIAEATCPLAPYNPYAAAFCSIGIGGVFFCATPDAAKLGELLGGIIDKVNSKLNPPLPTDAAVSISSQHKKYGTENAKQLTIGQIRSNENRPDATIIHEYTPKLKLTKVSGDNQPGEPNEELASPLVVKIEDEDNQPVEGIDVQWTATSGSGSVSPTTSKTGENGEARASWTLGEKEEGQTVLARAFDTPEKEVTGSPIEFKAIIQRIIFIEVTPSSTTVPLGGTYQLKARAIGVDGTDLTDNSNIQWASSNESIATVSQSGIVSGITGGNVDITAATQGVVGRARVQIIPPCDNQEEITITYDVIGTLYKFKAHGGFPPFKLVRVIIQPEYDVNSISTDDDLGCNFEWELATIPKENDPKAGGTIKSTVTDATGKSATLTVSFPPE